MSSNCSTKKSDLSGKAPEALISLDFYSVFPYKYWISTWSKDDQYPKGFRYKVLTVRREKDDQIELVVVLEEPGGLKTEMERARISQSAFERTARIIVDGLADEYDIDFEKLDLADVRTEAEFEKRITAAGWHEWKP